MPDLAPTACATDETLVRMATRAVLPGELPALREHVDDCDACGAALLALIRASSPGPTSTSTEMPAGTQLGRFTLKDVLGSGAMGTVFTATDPQLDRTVAIKVLRAGRDDPRDAARLLREAKAMAQVRHPNVVTVYEVGQDQDVVFVAMEQVRGTTLRTRLSERDVAVAVRLDWLAQIGRGLAAIHAAGLIHRDLKPDNIFVEDVADPEHGRSAQRVVIGDFGLAAADSREPDRELPAVLATGTRSAGTPAYMAPEQMHDDPLDARADIFAFGVTAWEVLTGARPFGGRAAAAAELAEAIGQGPVRTPAFEALPAAVRETLTRCIAYDREQRPSSIAQVTRVLEVRPRATRSRIVLVGTVAAAGVLMAVLGGRALQDRLDVVAASAPSICDPSVQARWTTTRAAWLARADGLSPFVRQELVSKMDRRSLAWSREAAVVCRRDAVAQQAWRLCRPKLEELEQRVLDVAVEKPWPDDQLVIQTLDRLAAPAYCASSEAAEDAVALSTLPSDIARAAVTEGLGWLTRADALDDLRATAARDEALSTATRIATSIAPSPLDGELELARVLLRPPSEPGEHVAQLQAAVATAERSGRASLIARAWMTLAERAAKLEIDTPTIDAAFTQADWAISRLGDPPRLRVRWLAADGSRAWTRGDRTRAKAQYATATQLAGDDQLLAWTSQLAVAKLASVAGDDHKAISVYREFLADPLFSKHASAENRITIETLLAEALYRLGELEEAQRTIDRAFELGRTTLPPNHPTQIANRIIAASIILDHGDGAAALGLLVSATQQARVSLGSDHVFVADARMRTAQVLMYEQRYDEGLVAAGEAVTIFDQRQGRRSEGSVGARYLIAEAHRVQGKLEASAKEFAELLADAEALYGPEHPMVAQLTNGQADLLTTLGRTDDARALLERSIPILTKGSSPDMVAYAKFDLAKLIEPSDHARAITLATEAEVALRGDPGWAADRKNVAAWLRRHARKPR